MPAKFTSAFWHHEKIFKYILDMPNEKQLFFAISLSKNQNPILCECTAVVTQMIDIIIIIMLWAVSLNVLFFQQKECDFDKN